MIVFNNVLEVSLIDNVVEISQAPADLFDLCFDSIGTGQTCYRGRLSFEVLLETGQLTVESHEVHSSVLLVKIFEMLSLPAIDGIQNSEISFFSAAFEFRRLQFAHFWQFFLVDIVEQQALADCKQFFLAELSCMCCCLLGRYRLSKCSGRTGECVFSEVRLQGYYL